VLNKSHVLYAAKLCFGLVLIAFLLFQADLLRDTFSIMTKMSMVDILLVLAMPVPLIWASCLKWQFILNVRGIEVRIASLMRFYTIGYFFNNFLPSSFGGDAARSFLLGRRIGSHVESVAAVILERLTGLATLIALALFGYLSTPSIHGDLLVVGSLAALVLGCIVLIAVIVMPHYLFDLAQDHLCQIKSLSRLIEKLRQIRTAVQTSLFNGKLVCLTGLYSFGYHILTMLNVYLASYVLGLDVSFSIFAP